MDGQHLIYQMGDEFCPDCRICYPDQKGFCEKCGGQLRPLNLVLVAHSHGYNSAFYSDKDDMTSLPHVAFHMTVGDLHQTPTYVLSFCDGQTRYPLELSTLFQRSESPIGRHMDRWIEFWDDERAPLPPSLEESDEDLWDAVRPPRRKPLGTKIHYVGGQSQKKTPRLSKERPKPKRYPQWPEEEDEEDNEAP
jgi:hypothetical protein